MTVFEKEEKKLRIEVKFWKKWELIGTVRLLRGFLGSIIRIQLQKLQRSLKTILRSQFSQKL